MSNPGRRILTDEEIAVRKYYITCRYGCKRVTHSNGMCSVHDKELAWYQYPDGSRRGIYVETEDLPPVNPCAECDSYAVPGDYLCGDCRV